MTQLKNRGNNYLISQIQNERYNYVLETLSNIDLPRNYSVFIYGTGKQTKELYEELQHVTGAKVIWVDFILRGFLKILKYVMAGYVGLIKIQDIKSIPTIFNKVCESSMAGIYIIDYKIEKLFIDEVKKKNRDVFSVNDVVINNSDNYFIYLIDNDAIDSETGIYEIKSIGERSVLKGVF
jgi:hypothetical protein